MLTLGIDSGSKTTKGVLFNGDAVVDTYLIPTSGNPRKSLYEVFGKLNHKMVEATVVTGYGRELLHEADKKVTEITCHARGSVFLNQEINSIIDIGGQDSKVILLNAQGKVVDFLMNDKCAAGTGRFIENMMGILDKEISHIDPIVKGAVPVTISSMCTVFAESEVVSLLAKEVSPGEIALGVIQSITKRTAHFAQRLPIEGPVFFSGGLAKSKTIRDYLENDLGKKIVTHPMAQFVGALGAAIIGFERGTLG
ncbi:MAG: acyl-CoA dehydratase activase [Eubacteriaceae bacterium]